MQSKEYKNQSTPRHIKGTVKNMKDKGMLKAKKAN